MNREIPDEKLKALPEFSAFSSCLPKVILSAMARRHKMPARALTGTRRTPEIYAVRLAMVHLCLDITGLTQNQLAAELGMKRGQIAHIAVAASDRLETDARFKAKMDQWSFFLRTEFKLPDEGFRPLQVEDLLGRHQKSSDRKAA